MPVAGMYVHAVHACRLPDVLDAMQGVRSSVPLTIDLCGKVWLGSAYLPAGRLTLSRKAPLTLCNGTLELHPAACVLVQGGLVTLREVTLRPSQQHTSNVQLPSSGGCLEAPGSVTALSRSSASPEAAGTTPADSVVPNASAGALRNEASGPVPGGGMSAEAVSSETATQLIAAGVLPEQVASAMVVVRAGGHLQLHYSHVHSTCREALDKAGILVLAFSAVSALGCSISMLHSRGVVVAGSGAVLVAHACLLTQSHINLVVKLRAQARLECCEVRAVRTTTSSMC